MQVVIGMEKINQIQGVRAKKHSSDLETQLKSMVRIQTNQTNQTNQMNQTNRTDQTNRMDQTNQTICNKLITLLLGIFDRLFIVQMLIFQ